jgi:hypothetical protein
MFMTKGEKKKKEGRKSGSSIRSGFVVGCYRTELLRARKRLGASGPWEPPWVKVRDFARWAKLF